MDATLKHPKWSARELNGTIRRMIPTSVGVISRLVETSYRARPVFMGPSCKTGTWGDCVETMEIVVEAWKCLPHGDVLEALFGHSRMIDGHSDNCSVTELHDRFMSAMNLDYIYERHPELEREPRQLKMFRMRHMDPLHFKAELHAGSCDLKLCWEAAVTKAEVFQVETAHLVRFRHILDLPLAAIFLLVGSPQQQFEPWLGYSGSRGSTINV
ncbi:hypothetical protein B0H11DRAFT_1905199 [Mycena galericulata]|nr:hypothetical protein B0H11DRAFT_1905199 [Mycena galericulata]